MSELGNFRAAKELGTDRWYITADSDELEPGQAITIVLPEATARGMAEWERMRDALRTLYSLGPRPWMDGKITWPEWDAAMSQAEAVLAATQEKVG